ncbi:hypothetical protein B0H11DRAFT_1900369 [Mycena galericulata]|nr:hypothetical protein B0H11DRAFT_1900369 [Mycena galericulata]
MKGDLSDTARVYSDAEFAALIAALHLSHPPSPPPRTPSPAEIFPRESPPPTPANLPPRTPSPSAPPPATATPSASATPLGQPLYYYESPTKSGYTDSWATAGAATQGVPGAYVEAVVSRPKKKKSKKKAAYVVFVGRRCGVFRKWSDVAPYVNGVPNAIHCGYRTVSQAEAAYAYACSKSWTRQWIWYSGSIGGTDVDADGQLHEDIRIEWTKSRARADRWKEEVILLEEEMRRVLEFCAWKARWWDQRVAPARGEGRAPITPELAEGLCAYALAQAARERAWGQVWAARWAAVRARATLVMRDEVQDVTEGVMVPLEVELDEEDNEEDGFDGFDEEDDL